MPRHALDQERRGLGGEGRQNCGGQKRHERTFLSLEKIWRLTIHQPHLTTTATATILTFLHQSLDFLAPPFNALYTISLFMFRILVATGRSAHQRSPLILRRARPFHSTNPTHQQSSAAEKPLEQTTAEAKTSSSTDSADDSSARLRSLAREDVLDSKDKIETLEVHRLANGSAEVDSTPNTSLEPLKQQAGPPSTRLSSSQRARQSTPQPKKIEPKPGISEPKRQLIRQLAAIEQATKQRTAQEEFLIKSRRAGMSYKEIKRIGNFTQKESTLRGRFHILTKRNSADRSHPPATDAAKPAERGTSRSRTSSELPEQPPQKRAPEASENSPLEKPPRKKPGPKRKSDPSLEAESRLKINVEQRKPLDPHDPNVVTFVTNRTWRPTFSTADVRADVLPYLVWARGHKHKPGKPLGDDTRINIISETLCGMVSESMFTER